MEAVESFENLKENYHLTNESIPYLLMLLIDELKALNSNLEGLTLK